MNHNVSGYWYPFDGGQFMKCESPQLEIEVDIHKITTESVKEIQIAIFNKRKGANFIPATVAPEIHSRTVVARYKGVLIHLDAKRRVFASFGPNFWVLAKWTHFCVLVQSLGHVKVEDAFMRPGPKQVIDWTLQGD